MKIVRGKYEDYLNFQASLLIMMSLQTAWPRSSLPLNKEIASSDRPRNDIIKAVYNPPMNFPAKNTYFGMVSLIASILSASFLGANIGVSQLNITPETFNSLNNTTLLTACVSAPLAVLLGVIGLFKRDDSKLLSAIALALVGAPFLILFVQMIFSIARSN